MQTNAVDRGQTDRSRNNIAQFQQFAAKLIKFFDEIQHVLIQEISFTGETEFLFTSLNQMAAKMFLHGTDLLTHGRLGNPIDLSSFGETFGLSQITKHFNAFYLHDSVFYLSLSVFLTRIFPLPANGNILAF